VALADICTALLLFYEFRRTGRNAFLVLACAYLYGAVMALAQVAAFPGALGAPLFGTSQTAAWIFLAWRLGTASLFLAAVLQAQVPAAHTIFEGHFPGYPIMPGVLLTEAMAQSSGWLLLGVMKFERMPFLAMVKEAKMRGFVSPGDLLTIEAKIEHEGSGFAVTSAKVRVGKDLKCSADLTFRHIPFPHPDLRVHMDAMANKIGFPMQALSHD